MQDTRLFVRYLILQARHLIWINRQRELSPYNISVGQSHILGILHQIGHKVTLTELAKLTERATSSTSVQLNRMENDGLVEKIRENPKSNLLSFTLTEKGRNIYKLCNKMEADKKIMSALSEAERQQLILMLEKIIYRAEKRLRSQT